MMNYKEHILLYGYRYINSTDSENKEILDNLYTCIISSFREWWKLLILHSEYNDFKRLKGIY